MSRSSIDVERFSNGSIDVSTPFNIGNRCFPLARSRLMEASSSNAYDGKCRGDKSPWAPFGSGNHGVRPPPPSPPPSPEPN
ncbi:hypothetical protein BLOT_011259 [Blomia tropicalis]|nr:hypothetical protein BLOT_011259 [Blomia tropicalis]